MLTLQHVTIRPYDTRLLVQHYDRLFPNDEPARVLVPLCGKSLDLVFLWQRGHSVTGIEGVAGAVPAFCRESGVQLQPASPGSSLVRHQTADKRLSIITADLFQVSDPSVDQMFTAVWDRASLYAVEPDMRQQYVEAIKRLLVPAAQFRYLLTTMEYDETLVTGPPHSIREPEVRRLFADFAEIERLSESDVSFHLPKFDEKGAHVKEVVYLLTRKQPQ